MGAKGLLLKNTLSKILAGGVGFAIIHAIIFWIAFFQCGGFHDSAKGIWAGITSTGGNWAVILKWTGFPLASISASGAAFVCLMILNSLLWGAVIGIVIGFITGRK